MSASPIFPWPCLIADVGGTNARFAMLDAPDAALTPVQRLETGGDADFAATTRRALAAGRFDAPRSFLLAVAGPVEGRSATLTNARTSSGVLNIDGPSLAISLGLDQGLLLNDFEALSLSLPFIPRDGLADLGGGTALADAPMVVVGPGTGLGVGALARHDGRWLPISGEGGHASIGPATEAEFALWPHLGSGAVSAEDLLSGRGLERLYRAVAVQRGQPAPATAASAVAERALAGLDDTAVEAVARFLVLLARFAGGMALAFGARGGAFIGGGITPRLMPLVDEESFVGAFRGTSSAEAYLRRTPLRIIAASDAALLGLAEIARDPGEFAVDYRSRFWT